MAARRIRSESAGPRSLVAPLVAVLGAGCATMDIPAAHRGRLFEHTGPATLYLGGKGFSGAVLGPGTYYTGAYNEVLMVDCSTVTQHDPLTVLTRDGVQFGLDIYVRFSANCTDEAVQQILSSLTPDKPPVITSRRLFETFIRPAIGAVVRESVSPYRANDVNERHQEILAAIRKRFHEVIDSHEGDVVRIYEVTLSNLDFPEAMDTANVDRAVQSILKDKAVAERERVRAEIETATLRKDLASAEGNAAAARIDAIGAALARNPDYLQYDMQTRMPGIYADAGAHGNLIIAAPSPTVNVGARPGMPASVGGNGTASTPPAPTTPSPTAADAVDVPYGRRTR